MDEQLKERLVGAVVLMALAVIFIPMILSGPKDPPSSRAQSSEPKDFTSRIVALEPNSSTAPARRSDPPTASASPASEGASTTRPPPKDAVTAKVKPAPQAPSPAKPEPTTKALARDSAPAPVRAKAPPTAPKLKLSDTTAEVPSPAKGWVVQLGSFANKNNAQGLKARLIKLGYNAFVKTSLAAGAEVTRVYVGPESSKDAAKAQLPALLKETKLKGLVTRFDG